jgi:16S rRNA (uracil1498-N3)-methyltransferase
MNLPFFYIDHPAQLNEAVILDEANSRHISQVLRMEAGEKVNLTDGKGNRHEAEIITPHKKKTELRILQSSSRPAPSKALTIAISTIKNSSRFEWFLEKAAEIGVKKIQPLICDRTERQQFKPERWQQILVSAMLQSEQCWLTELPEPKKFESFLDAPENADAKKFVAHCLEGNKKSLAAYHSEISSPSTILIGPEGDFTPNEIELAILRGYVPVSLGNNRLRTETAGIVAASWLVI